MLGFSVIHTLQCPCALAPESAACTNVQRGPQPQALTSFRPQADGDLPATRAALEAALAIDAAYVPAALGLARLQRQPGAAQDLTLAAAHVVGALRAQPDSATAWCSPDHLAMLQAQ